MARQNSNTVQDFSKVEFINGIATLVVAATAVATTTECSRNVVDSSLSYGEFLAALGLSPNTNTTARLDVEYTIDQGERAVVRYVTRTWRGTVGAAHDVLCCTEARHGDWVSYLLAAMTELLNTVAWSSMGATPLVGIGGAPYAALRVNGAFHQQVQQ